MLIKKCFSNNLILPSMNLPLTLISMEEWSIITVSGSDHVKYMQNQLTCDINLIKKTNFSFAAHCNNFGKTIGFLCIFYYNGNLLLIVRRSLAHKHLLELKKYSVFFDINIEINTDLLLLGVAGFQSTYFVENLFFYNSYKMSQVNFNKDVCVVHFNSPRSRFLIITKTQSYNNLLDNFKKKIPISSSKQWLSLDIESGYPIIDEINSGIFVPQSINIKNINGISFNKGCYIGQEIIAKIEYKKINKYFLYWLEGCTDVIPIIGDQLEVKINKSWIKTGRILSYCKLKDNNTWIQTVLNNNIVNRKSIFRMSNDILSVFKIIQ